VKNVNGIFVWGDPIDEGALAQAVTCRRTSEHVALMADHHLGYAVPIGGVVLYKDAISPSGVGYDIGCGNKAVRLDCFEGGRFVREEIRHIMDEIVRRISFGMGRNNDTPVEHPMFDRGDTRWDHPALRPLKRMAANQLGTVGGGNHYVDVFTDEQDRVWVGCHFGSRGLGHKTATWFLKAGGAKDQINAEPLVLPMSSALGQEYVECMKLAGEYAYAGRDWVCAEVARIIGADIVEEVHNHHNFAWQERHFEEDVWVVRKGATPAFPGQRGFIGASMGEPAKIVHGVQADEAVLACNSTVHGAGRAMSRTAARGKTNRRTGEIISPGRISREQMDEATLGVELRGGDLDEAPQAYKRLHEVLAHHAATLAVEHTLTPIGVAMAGRDVYDPFKD
jgi:tRNA-splicing ligase RtcB